MWSKKKKITLGVTACVLVVVLVMFSTLGIWGIRSCKEQKERKEQVQAYHDAKFALYEEENEKYADFEVDVAFFGDSLTDLYDLTKYYPQYVTANRGIGGNTTFDLEKRMQISVYDLKPKVVVMLIGANNPNTMFENYENLLIGLQKNLPQTKVVLLSMTAMGGEHWGVWNETATLNNVKIELYAKKYGFTFVDLFTPLFDISIGEVYADYTIDGGHFTPKGYEVITSIITPVLHDLLGY
ncbi:MAG: hypothetical protein E7368_05235 [Clostridiales bacterium]|nr:hypothetical protein [Clostridiales bacterium]